MPVGDSDHAVARGLQADLSLAAHIATHKAKHQFTVCFGNEQLGKLRHIRRGKVAHTVNLFAAKRIQQTVIHNQSWRNDQKLARESQVIDSFHLYRRFIEQLPNQQSLQHPGLARSGRHLQAIFRMRVFSLRHFTHPAASQQRVRRSLLIEIEQSIGLQNLMRDDGVEYRLPLPRMKIQRAARGDHILAKPPLQQLRRSGRDQFINIRHAIFQADTKLIGLRGQASGESELIFGFCRRLGRGEVTHAASTVATTSASKPNTSTTRTHTRRAPCLAGSVNTALVTTRSGSPSLSVLPR